MLNKNEIGFDRFKRNMKVHQLEGDFPKIIEEQGRKFVVLKNVFDPSQYRQAEEVTQMLEFKEGMSFLEIGGGAGITSITAALKGCKVVVTDINPDAVRNMRINALLNGVEDKMDIRQGDVYSCIKEGEHFDLIYWNFPFWSVNPDEKLSFLEMAIADPGYVSYRKFCEGRKFLKDDSSLMIILFSTVQAEESLLIDATRECGKELIRYKTFQKLVDNDNGDPIDLVLYKIIDGAPLSE